MTTDTGQDPKGAGNAVPASERDGLARALVARFVPHHLDPEYLAELAAKHIPIPPPTGDVAMVVEPAGDGHPSIRSLTFGEIADAILAAGYRRVVEDDRTVMRLALALSDVDGTLTDPRGYCAYARAALAALQGGE